MANYEIEWEAQVSGTTGTGVGQWVVYNGTAYVPATAANIASYSIVRGVIITPVVNGVARIQFNGPVPQSVHGLTYSALTPYVVLDTTTALATLSASLGTANVRLGLLDASNLMHITIATGAAVYTVEATDFGYVGDGTTDDAPAIQAMLDASPRSAYLTSGDLILHIPATASGGVIKTPITARWDTPGNFVGGFILRGGNSSGTSPLTDTVLSVQIPTPNGGAGVTVTAISIGTSSGYTYATLSGFPANTFTAADVNSRVEMSGCSNAALNGRGLICKYISSTSVAVWCPSTVTNATTVGTWRVLRSAFRWWTRDCEASGLVFYPHGAGTKLRSIFETTEAPGAGANICTGNHFTSISCTPNGGASCDYVFDFARSIVPEAASSHFVDDGNGISKPYMVPDVDVMRVTKCSAAAGMKGLMQFDSQLRQSRQHVFVENGAVQCESYIQCSPMFDPTLDGGLLWASSVQFNDSDSAFSECTSYAYYLGIGQAATVIINNPQYEAAAGLLGFFHQVQGYEATYVIRDGYHTIISDRVEPLSPFIQAPNGPLFLDNVHIPVIVSPAVATTLIQLALYAHIIAVGCTFPNTGNSPPGLNGGSVYGWAATDVSTSWARVTEIACNDFYASGVEWRPRATKIDEIQINTNATGYPYNGAGIPALTGTTGIGTHIHRLRSFSTTTLPQINTPVYICQLKDLETSIAIDLPALEYQGDRWVADVSVIATSSSPASGSRNVTNQRSGVGWFAIDFAAKPGAGEYVTYAILLRRQATTVTTQIAFAQMQTLYAMYDATWYWDNNSDGAGKARWASLDGTENADKHMYGLVASKPSRNTTSANFNSYATLSFTATKLVQAILPGVASGSWSLIIALKRAAGSGTTEIFQAIDSVGVTSASLYHSAGTLKMTTTAGGAATLDSLIDVGTGSVVIGAIFAGAGSKIYPNKKTAIAGALGATTMDSYVVGAYTGADGIIGEVAGWAITNRAMGDDEMKSCMIAVAAKYGITLGA